MSDGDYGTTMRVSGGGGYNMPEDDERETTLGTTARARRRHGRLVQAGTRQ